MRRLSLLIASTLVLAGCAAGDDPEPSEPRGLDYPAWTGELPEPGSLAGPVWLVAVDGASWGLMRPLMDRGELPSFSRLAATGTHGVLMSEEPTISPALWATIATGVPRDVHGVENFTVKLPGSYAAAEAGTSDRIRPAIWEYVGAAGGRSAVLSWFGSYPAEAIPGVYLSKGLDPAAPGTGQVHPPEWVAHLRAVSVEPPMHATTEIARTDYLRDQLIEDARTMAMLEAVAAADSRPDFVAVYFSGIDVVQHVTWRHMDRDYVGFPGDGPRLEELADVIPAYYRYVDGLLGRVVELAPDDATIVVVSDHGAGPMEPEQAFHFRLETLLETLGYTSTRPGEPGTIDGARTTAFTISELYRERKHVWLNLEGVEAEGTVPLEQAGATAERIAERLRGLTTEAGDPVFERVELRTEAAGWQPGEPSLELRFSREALPAARIFDRDRSYDMTPVRLRHSDVSGAHRLEGILLIHGPAIRVGELEAPANLYHVAPTLLYLLGLPQAGRMLADVPARGGVLEAAIRPEVLAERPVRTMDYPDVDRTPLLRASSRPEANPDHEEAMEKLRSLGYIE